MVRINNNISPAIKAGLIKQTNAFCPFKSFCCLFKSFSSLHTPNSQLSTLTFHVSITSHIRVSIYAYIPNPIVFSQLYQIQNHCSQNFSRKFPEISLPKLQNKLIAMDVFWKDQWRCLLIRLMDVRFITDANSPKGGYRVYR